MRTVLIIDLLAKFLADSWTDGRVDLWVAISAIILTDVITVVA